MSFRLIKFSVIAIVVALSGCSKGGDNTTEIDGKNNPLAQFNVELTAPESVGQNQVFSMSAIPENSEGAVTYQWFLNDEIISSNLTHHTMMPVVGDYTLTVIAIDSADNKDTQTKKVSVIPQTSLNPYFSFGVNVSDKAGFALVEVPVTINGTTVKTNQFGLAQFDDISQTEIMLVSASKKGYLTQTAQYNFETKQETAEASLTLQKINSESHTVDSSEDINIMEAELHTKLILNADSFVDSEGNAITGEVDITITPIDIRAVDSAFLGGGQALTSSGEAVGLISTGMADFQFSQNGSKVSLAEGVSATIEMDLAVITGDDGRMFVEGDTIEMWWFDSKTGFWIEDGVGTVQLSDTSETGLKLVASVTHFTTWNWDYYKRDDRSSIVFNCFKNDQPLTENESCQITASSSSISRQFVASSEGVTAVNAPPNVEFLVTANTTSENVLWAGNAIFTTVSGENTVNVTMTQKETETGYLQCRIINDTVTSIVPCNSVITSASSGEQNVDSSDSSNYRAEFVYVKGDVLNISATVGAGLSQTLEPLETSGINGTLDIEIIFDIKLGSLQCSATLDGINMEYFPCEALVTGSDDIQSTIWNDDFSGNPLKASFTYSKEADGLEIEIASIFDEARLRQYNHGPYISGEGNLIFIDLTSEVPFTKINYEIQTKNLYSFVCIDEMNSNVDCHITWYNNMETILFDGNITELTSDEILPTWMNGKIHIEELGFGDARYQTQDQYFYPIDTDIDAVNKVITFTFAQGGV